LLIITAEGASHVDIADPRFLGTLAELGLLAAIILMLAWAMRLLRNSTVNAPGDTTSLSGG
jgi:flagellar biogenesis protein FliO